MERHRDALHCEERPLRHADVHGSFRPDTSHSERMAGYPVQGYMRRFTVRDALAISCFDLCSPQPFDGRAKSDPTFVVTVLLECGGHSLCTSAMGNAPLRFPYVPNTLVYTFTRAVTEGLYAVPPNTRFRGVEVRLSHEHLARLGALDLFLAASSEHPFHTASNVDLWLGTIPAQVETMACAERILDIAFADPADDLTIETCGLSILSQGIAAMRGVGARSGTEIRQWRPQLEKARELLLADLAHAWTIGELATAAGLTEKRLKVGFRAAFGTPVHMFLQGARLAHARQLLASSVLTVTEVSLAVGYANPSHFAYLFRRAFGASPSNRRPPSGG